MTGKEILNEVMTAPEAAKRWGKATVTIRHACSGYKKSPPKFNKDECRFSEGFWLVTVAGMTRVYGEEP